MHVHVSGEVEYLGMVVNAGSRDEDISSHGLAHFVEHTIFKGTRRRKSWHIINRMESVGGELNAYTTKEETVVYTIFPRGSLVRAAELLSDLISSSVFPEKELKKEREVVEDEISSYLDTPSESIFDDFDETVFAGSAMAHNILGTADNLSHFSSETCRNWLDTRYTPGNMVLFYTGPCSVDRFYTTALKYFSLLNHKMELGKREAPAVNAVFDRCEQKGLHQSHTVAGVRIPGMHSGRRSEFALIVNMLGGPGMNSLLNFEMREKRGLVYTVEAMSSLYSDCGLLSVYYGCDHDDEPRCRSILAESISRLHDSTTPRKLEMAKKQLIGQLALARQNTENCAISAGRQTLYTGTVRTPSQVEEDIHSVGIDRFRAAVESVSPDKLSFLTFR